MKSNYDYAKESRIHNIYGTGSTQVHHTGKAKKVFMAIGFIILVALISVASCAAYLAASGYLNIIGNSEYKVNQISSGVTSVSSSETGALSTPEIIQKVLPSVVGITTATVSGSGSGSGIVFSEDGYIVTNQHVIKDAISVTATLSDGKEYEATVVGQDERTDLAVIKINAGNLWRKCDKQKKCLRSIEL